MTLITNDLSTYARFLLDLESGAARQEDMKFILIVVEGSPLARTSSSSVQAKKKKLQRNLELILWVTTRLILF
ncbi:hypothetical protein GIHI108528_14455 [Gillisia hiemivivida]